MADPATTGELPDGPRSSARAAGSSPRRLASLPRVLAMGRVVPLASTRRTRALGLAMLDRHSCGPGLLIPRCSSIHTFGMRFELDVFFLDSMLRPLAMARGVGPRRVLAARGARHVLELPSRRVDAGRSRGCAG